MGLHLGENVREVTRVLGGLRMRHRVWAMGEELARGEIGGRRLKEWREMNEQPEAAASSWKLTGSVR